MIDTLAQTTCKNCGKPVPYIPGHRRRQYCNNTCKQTAYRKRKEEQQPNDVTIVDDSTLQRIDELEQEVQRLQGRLNVEERYRADTQVRHFKSWLRSHSHAHDTDFAKRFLDDTRLPQHASRAFYVARLKLYGYTAEDMLLFEEVWKDMLLQQS